jgi:hypothetical protein
VKLATDMTADEYRAHRAEMIRHSRQAPSAARAEPAAEVTPKDKIDAELKDRAAGFGLIDLDWLKLADLSTVRVNEQGAVEGAAELIGTLRKAKPYLFADVSTSSSGRPPTSEQPRTKLATQMTKEEYAKAKADLIRR